MTVDEWTKIITAAVALVAVLLGPILQWRIAKRQAADNISSKRQNWIDELRNDGAEFIQLLARLEELRRPAPNLSLEDQKLVFDESAVANARAFELGMRIKLRLNPNEDEHNTFVKLLGSLSDACKDPVPGETEDQRKAAMKKFNAERDKVVGQLQIILKREWERVKSGK